jgi:hypothetical protein
MVWIYCLVVNSLNGLDLLPGLNLLNGLDLLPGCKSFKWFGSTASL